MQHGMLTMALQSLLGLCIVLGLFALVIWGVRRFQNNGGRSIKRDLSIVQRIHLDNKNSIVEICHKDRHYLLAISPGGMVQLHHDHALNTETSPPIQVNHHA